MNSVPVEIAQLGLGADDYSEIARNVERVLNMNRDSWNRILDRANSELSDEVLNVAVRLPRAMAYDREFFREAGLEYWKGPPVQGCFVTSVADYLLRNQDRLLRL